MRFFYKLMSFVQGRYGIDETFYVLFGISATLAITNLFLRLWQLQIIVYIISAVAILRFFSRNHSARAKENKIVADAFLSIRNKYYTHKTRKADKTHIYKKCPNCKAVLRLPRKKGKHSAVCPNCQIEFSVRVFKK